MRKTDITKNTIINSTIKLLRENGNATVKEICDDAGVNIASINYHFSDKETLIEVVLRRIILDIKQKIENTITSDVSENKKNLLREIMNVFMNAMTENNNVILFILSPENKRYAEACNKYFLNAYSSKSEFAYKLITTLAPGTKSEDVEPKYLCVISTICMPLLSKFEQQNKNSDRTLFQLQDSIALENYINTIFKILQ